MTDRLTEIKARSKPTLVVALDQPDIFWLIAEVERLKLSMTRLLDDADDLIADWQSGNIQTKDMAVRLHAFVEDVRAAPKDQP